MSDLTFTAELELRKPYINLVNVEPPQYVYAGYVLDRGVPCYIYVFYWPFQEAPRHEHDYEPIFLCGQDSAAYDWWHYSVGRAKVQDPVYIRFVEGYRAIEMSEPMDISTRDYPLTDLRTVVNAMAVFGFNTDLLYAPLKLFERYPWGRHRVNTFYRRRRSPFAL